MISYFIRTNGDILNAAIKLGIEIGISIDHPNYFFISLPDSKHLLIPLKRWVVVKDGFVSILTDEEYKMLADL